MIQLAETPEDDKRRTTRIETLVGQANRHAGKLAGGLFKHRHSMTVVTNVLPTVAEFGLMASSIEHCAVRRRAGRVGPRRWSPSAAAIRSALPDSKVVTAITEELASLEKATAGIEAVLGEAP